MASIGSSKASPFIKYKYVVGDAMAMPFPDDHFDCVLDTFGLEYTLNPHKALQEMRRYPRLNQGCANAAGRLCS
jgi:ubiquinone/menaquinone biosynthesis C-methylase UbiE